MSRSRLLPATALAIALAACGKSDAPPAGGQASPLGTAAKVEAIASTLQACSYDGQPVSAQPGQLAGQAPGECSLAVQRIMGFTGLPANFVVTAGPVDNAAAVILLDGGRVPRRVIAFNPGFMAAARARVNGSDWGPTSIMAMGSPHGTPTHPGRDERAAAIRQGWTEACRQTGCQAGQAAGAPPAAPDAAIPPPSATPATAGAVAAPLPRPGSIPLKDGRFVIDETGRLDPARTRAFEQRLYRLAKEAGAEFTILVVNDLRGLSAQDYAWAMMRQLRVGKLDVGNGAVAVVAPRQRQAAVAFGPGFAKEAEFSNPVRSLTQWTDAAWRYCDDADGCQGWTDNLFKIFNLTLNYAGRASWRIKYQSLGQLVTDFEAREAERLRSRRAFDATQDQPIGKLLRVRGRITSLRPAPGWNGANERLLGGALGYTAVEMRTDDGYPLILYVAPRLAGLMPAGALQAGADYTAVGRLQKRGDRKSQASGMWLFSYDRL